MPDVFLAVPAFQKLTRLSLLTLSVAFPALAQEATLAPITGTVTNKTTGKMSAGDDVVLIQLKQGMQESTRTKTDARGHYKLTVPDDGIHLVRVTHDKANYFQPATPGTQTVNIDVYNAQPKLDGVKLGVQELHIEATDTELHIVEVLQVVNSSEPKQTQFGPGGFDFYLPADAHIERTGAVTDGGMPVPATAAPVGDPGHYTFLFPIRPGETQFGIFYTVPYSKSLKYTPRLAENATTLAIVLPKSMKLQPGPSAPYGLTPTGGDTQTFIAQNVSPSQPLDFTLSGTGTLPKSSPAGNQNGPGPGAGQGTAQGQAPTAPESGGAAPNPDTTKFGGGRGTPLDPNADHDPWSKYKGWILGGLALLLAVAAGILLRRPPARSTDGDLAPPSVPPAPLPFPVAAATPSLQRHQALKEELYSLETDRLQKKISQEEYDSHKRALDLIMLRAISREAAVAETNTPAEKA